LKTSVMADRLLRVIRDGRDSRGRYRLDWSRLIWALHERSPARPRPKLHEVHRALQFLRLTRRIRTRTAPGGRRVAILVEPPADGPIHTPE